MLVDDAAFVEDVSAVFAFDADACKLFFHATWRRFLCR
jgi:hypothetical protein